jgi:hypothetical protein
MLANIFLAIKQLWQNWGIRVAVVLLSIGLIMVLWSNVLSYSQHTQRVRLVEMLMRSQEPIEFIQNPPQIFYGDPNEVKPICLTLKPQYHHLVRIGNQVSVQRSNGILSVFFPEADGEWLYNASVSGTLFRSDNQPLDRKDILTPCYSSSGAGAQRWAISSKIREFWYWASYETSS